jgi:hypothetical protein
MGFAAYELKMTIGFPLSDNTLTGFRGGKGLVKCLAVVLVREPLLL